MPKPTERFSDRANAYAAHRPSYPPEVFDFLFERLNASHLTVADVGAGTGISTLALADRVARVLAIEPNAEMRSKAQPLPNVEWREGTAEAIPLEDKSVDVACAFQAFHWFDPGLAFREFFRVARFRVAMVQYERDETGAFSAAYAATIAPFMIDDTEARRLRAIENFKSFGGKRLHSTAVAFVQELDLDGVLGRIDSSSYLPKAGDSGARLRAAARDLFAGHAHGGTVDMAMLAYVMYMDV